MTENFVSTGEIRRSEIAEMLDRKRRIQARRFATTKTNFAQTMLPAKSFATNSARSWFSRSDFDFLFHFSNSRRSISDISVLFFESTGSQPKRRSCFEYHAYQKFSNSEQMSER